MNNIGEVVHEHGWKNHDDLDELAKWFDIDPELIKEEAKRVEDSLNRSGVPPNHGDSWGVGFMSALCYIKNRENGDST